MLAAVGIGVAAVLFTADPEPPAAPEVAADELADESPALESVEEPDSEMVEEPDTSEDCSPVDTDYISAPGWFSSLTDGPVNGTTVQVGQTLYTANNVILEFPVVGGPVYFAAGALWATGEPIELFSATAAVDSRAVDAPTGGEMPEDYLILDSSNRIEGTIGMRYGAGDSAAVAPIPARFAATYDPVAGVVTGTVSLPEIELEFTAEGTVETRPHYPSAACYREAREASSE